MDKEKQKDRGGLGVTGNRKIEPKESYHIIRASWGFCTVLLLFWFYTRSCIPVYFHCMKMQALYQSLIHFPLCTLFLIRTF